MRAVAQLYKTKPCLQDQHSSRLLFQIVVGGVTRFSCTGYLKRTEKYFGILKLTLIVYLVSKSEALT